MYYIFTRNVRAEVLVDLLVAVAVRRGPSVLKVELDVGCSLPPPNHLIAIGKRLKSKQTFLNNP